MNTEDIDKKGSAGKISRRTFIGGSAALGTAAFLGPTSKVLGANNRLRIGVCGVNGRGNSHLRSFGGIDGVEIAWIVDPDRRLLESRSEQVKERNGNKPKTTTDVRKALDDKDLDAIVVATPNHWHSLMVIWAAQAGKHCYVEKPASHDINEGRVALEAARKYGVVVQHGTQSRSSTAWAARISAIQSGKYGRLAVSHAFACKRRSGIGYADPASPPDWLDWNMWRGHALADNYHGNLVHYDWHWFWVTGNGDLNNQGTHQLDIAYWALDPEMHTQTPVKATCVGGRFDWDDQGQTPNTQFGVAEYPNGQKVIMNVRNVDYPEYEHQVENRFYFEDGGKIIGNTYISPDGKEEELDLEAEDVEPRDGHRMNFVQACRANDPSMVPCSMLEGHYSSTLGHLMNNSYRLGQKQPLQEVQGRFDDYDPWVAQEFSKVHSIVTEGMDVENEQYVVGPWLNFNPKTEWFVGDHSLAANRLVRDPRRAEFDIPSADSV